MANDNLPPWLNALLRAECYPHPAPDIRLVQTHISYVLLAGDYVYKFKKPVNFGFLDFSAADRRHHFCEQELLLNRRLCPDLYLGLVEVTEENGGFALNGSGRPVEWGVRMRRMPEEIELSPVILKTPISPLERRWVPPHSSREKPSRSTTRTLSPYFSSKMAMAPERTASS